MLLKNKNTLEVEMNGMDTSDIVEQWAKAEQGGEWERRKWRREEGEGRSRIKWIMELVMVLQLVTLEGHTVWLSPGMLITWFLPLMTQFRRCGWSPRSCILRVTPREPGTVDMFLNNNKTLGWVIYSILRFILKMIESLKTPFQLILNKAKSHYSERDPKIKQ